MKIVFVSYLRLGTQSPCWLIFKVVSIFFSANLFPPTLDGLVGGRDGPWCVCVCVHARSSYTHA